MKSLSIVIPIYNESLRLYKTFSALYSFKVPRGLTLDGIIFVNDGSTDKTKSEIKKQAVSIEKILKTKVILISYPKNKGKGYANSQGMKASNSDYTLFCDADMSTDFSEVKKFLPAMKRSVPIIIGTRKNGKSTVTRHQPFIRELMGKVFTISSNIILNTWVTDFTCGFKAFSKEAKDTLFPMLKTNRWNFDAEVIFLGRISGFEYQEIPVLWTDDRRSKVNLLSDVPQTIIDLFKVRIFQLANKYE